MGKSQRVIFRSIVGAAGFSLLLGASLSVSRSAFAGNRQRECPKHLQHRTPEETVDEHLALIAAGDIDRAMCDYAPNATVITTTGPISGLDNIRNGLSFFTVLFGGAAPQITSTNSAKNAVFITFTVQGPQCSIPDGADTYVVEKGHIVLQTAHDTLKSSPGQTCPFAAPGS